MRDLGFIILRYVNSHLTNKYWIESYNCIRKFYPENQIIIIDDSSNYNYVTEITLYKTTIINNEYPRRGELMPYIYYLKNKLFDTAVIIHDSVFINKYIDFSVHKYKFIWEIGHTYDNISDELKMIRLFKNNNLLKFYRRKRGWKGCFGAMMIIKYDFLVEVNKKYDLTKLLNVILTRENRSSFERIIACLFQIESSKMTLLGNIRNYVTWGISYNEKDNFSHLPIIKVWTGR